MSTRTCAVIYLTAGPSGAGKDTLLLGARQALAEAEDHSVLFVRRHVTRDPSKVTELEVSVTADEYLSRSAAGEYALEWSAHETCYGIPAADLEAGLAAGRRVVLNTSRSVVDTVLREYGQGRGLEVYCLNVTASEAALRSRLSGRGRESDAEVEARIAGGVASAPRGPHVIDVVNEGTVAQGVADVLRALRVRRADAPGGAQDGAEEACRGEAVGEVVVAELEAGAGARH